MPTIRVELGPRSYPIEIERGILDHVGERLVEAGLEGRAAVVTNPLVGGLYNKRLLSSLKKAGFDAFTITIPDGEEYKTLSEASKIYDALIEHRMERSSPVVALGGGVIGDITGFAAATYLRGVPYVQVPTTLLAQVDSSVGGKTAVNHKKGKNLIGSFYQPAAVYIDPDVLNTLDERDVRSGMSEVVKYGVIRDAEFFRFLEANAENLLKLKDEILTAIKRSCEIKAEVVSADEREETGVRAVLNFGHTFGHAIETLSGYGTFKHGEAVSIGMVMAAALSVRLGLCEAELGDRLQVLLASLGLPVKPPALNAASIIEALRHDKKVASGRLRFVLARGVGSVVLRDVTEDEIEEFLS
ncbi:MAG: 3-dehydroquinate synthase [Thermodesulfobacteriota bacterium]|nr:MAG: 3-dehydroquinate synthase [Thermodesulfobacteriota bacterium]